MTRLRNGAFDAGVPGGGQIRADETSLPGRCARWRSISGSTSRCRSNWQFKDESGQACGWAIISATASRSILVLAYFRCPMLCTEVSNGLVRAMLDMDLNVGNDFDVVTVSFDPRETPEMAAAKKKTYLERYGRPGADAGWHFLTGREEVRSSA